MIGVSQNDRVERFYHKEEDVILGDLTLSDMGCELEIDGVDHGEFFGAFQMGSGKIGVRTELTYEKAEERELASWEVASIYPLETPCVITDRSYNIPSHQLKVILETRDSNE